jgi:hypothetical protein
MALPESVNTELSSAVGKIIDAVLEGWAIFVVTALAGSFATFFSSGDAS